MMPIPFRFIFRAALFIALLGAGSDLEANDRAAWTLANLTRSAGQREGEPVVVIDPTSPRHAVVALVGAPRVEERLFVYRSRDGGRTWVTTALTADGDGSVGGGNPALAADLHGNLFLAFLTHEKSAPVSIKILRARITEKPGRRFGPTEERFWSTLHPGVASRS